jgi:hypothetical protein
MKLEMMPAVVLLLVGSLKPERSQQRSQRLSHNKGGSLHIFKPPQGSTIKKNQSLTLQDGVEHAADNTTL